MNIKRIAISAAAGGMMLSAALPALAFGNNHSNRDRSGELEINNRARVTNNTNTVANTGLNAVTGKSSRYSFTRGGSIETGNATAKSDVFNDVNNNAVDACDCKGDVEINNRAKVRNNTNTLANSGANYVSKRGRISTGNASATGVVTNYVNTNIVN